MKIFKWLVSKEIDNNKDVESNCINNSLQITKVEIEPEAICPYCKIPLEKFPIRKTKCPNCKKSIFIRKSADSKNKTLITEEQAQEIDIEREMNHLKYKGFGEVERYGVAQDEFIKRKEEHFLKHGIENNNNDVVWSIYNELLIKNASDVEKSRMIYHSMAVFLHQEGKDNFKLLQLSAKALLDSYQDSDLTFDFQIIGSKDCCENCKKLNGKIISMEEAYLLPVPCRECMHSIGFCRCTYGAVPIRDSEGMLILKK